MNDTTTAVGESPLAVVQDVYDVPIGHVWKVQRGRVVRVEFYIDHPSMLPALQIPKEK